MTAPRHLQVGQPDGTWWDLSWDPTLASFEAVRLTVDRHEMEQILAWHGTEIGEIASIEQLRTIVTTDMPEDVAKALAADAAATPADSLATWLAARPGRRSPHIDYGMRWIDPQRPGVHHRLSWIPATGELYVTDGDERSVRPLGVVADRYAVDAALAGWESMGASPQAPLPWIERQVTMWLEAHPEHPPGPRLAAPSESSSTAVQHTDGLAWSLPAPPVTEVLRGLLGEAGFSTADVETFATGIGLDPALTDQLLTGRVGTLDVEQIAGVCEALRCSPYDLWGPEAARAVLYVYGPERWPRHIEPLDDDCRRMIADDPFVRRRIADRAEELAEPLTHALREPGAEAARIGALDLDVIPYRRVAVLACAPGRETAIAHAGDLGLDDVEYHFSFRQAAEPAVQQASISRDEFVSSPLPGFDTVPALQETASRVRSQPMLDDVELVRFVDRESGVEQWLGWDPAVQQWQTWDDPRRYYPGDPSDVLDPGEYAPAVVSLDPEPMGVGIYL